MAPKPWYQSDPESLARVAHEVMSRHPRMKFEDAGDVVTVRGVFEVREGATVLDAYEIELDLPRDSARGIPVVRETGGRIPRHEDRHVNAEDGALCVVLPEAYWHTYADGLSLVDFLDGPLQGYLAAQSLVERGEPWPAGEWRHGATGILEFYVEMFGTNEPKAIIGLTSLLARREIKGHWDCPCGSGKRLRHCHGPKVVELRNRLPRELITRLFRKDASGPDNRLSAIV